MKETSKNSNEQKNNPHLVRHHISQFYALSQDIEWDFFDANLVFDSRVFIDPFLLKYSPKEEERKLFERFGDFFRYAYDKSLELSLGRLSPKEFKRLVTFHEPKNINMGYARGSNDGHGPSLAEKLLDFFMDNATKRFVRETDAFPGAKYNPISIEVFTTGIGPDGISDITANLIMDYLISYTQHEAKRLGIPLTKELPLDHDGFDFDEMRWRGGGYYELPENPYHKGQALLFVPRRILRGLDETHDSAVSKVMHILRNDSDLSQRFSSLVSKRISDVDINEIRNVFKAEKSVHLKYMQLLEQERMKPYDFKNDPLGLFADKAYEDHFKNMGLPPLSSGQDLDKLVQLLIAEFQKEFAGRDGWKDAWKVKGTTWTPQVEPVIGRKFRAMGFALFSLFDEVTFVPEAGSGNGNLDFLIVYKNHRIAVELKLLKNAVLKGAPKPMPAYLQGLVRQLPHYVELHNAERAYYVTGQHYKGVGKIPDQSDRAAAIRKELPGVQTSLEKKLKGFKKITYVNVDMSRRPSASKM